MINDDRFLHTPHLPQYGDLRATCEANLPGSTAAAFVYILAGLGWFLGFGVLLQFAMRIPFPDPRMRAVAVAGGGIALLFVTRLIVRRIAGGMNRQALFVYDGGVHLNEDVTYTVSYGQWFSVCTGMRQVSIPWRKLEEFTAKEVKRKGEPAVEASFQMPDGRKLTVSTVDGKQSAAAIETLLTNLG